MICRPQVFFWRNILLLYPFWRWTNSIAVIIIIIKLINIAVINYINILYTIELMVFLFKFVRLENEYCKMGYREEKQN